MNEKEGFFKVKSVTDINELKEGSSIPESDLTIHNGDKIYQFEHVEPADDAPATIIKPGVFTLETTSVGVKLKKFKMKTYHLLKSIDNTSQIRSEANKFFSKIDIYKQLNREPKRAILLCSPPGVGKCLHPDTKVIMYDGSIKTAKEVVAGDKLMGPDSNPRNVLSTINGMDEMYEISPTKGDSYIVNKEHILSLVSTDTSKVVNIAVKDWLNKPDWFKERHKGYRSENINFPNIKELPIDPYILGLWLGDGSSASTALTSMDDILVDTWASYGQKFGLHTRIEFLENNKANTYHLTTGISHGGKTKNTLQNFLREMDLKNNKHIPDFYKVSSRKDRLSLIAGLIDSDGHLIHNCYEIVQKNEKLIEDIAFVVRSLGMACYIKEKKINETIYHRLFISGNISDIPVLLDRKKSTERLQCKNVLRTGIEVKPLGMGEYNGFVLDGDRLFLLGDFTVTHNTAAINDVCQEFLTDKKTSIVTWDTSSIKPSHVNKFFLQSSEFHNSVERFIFVIEDISGGVVEENYGSRGVESSLLNLLDGIGNPFKGVSTFIIATTNNPEQSVGALIDRPGRFDKVIELKTPNKKECLDLLAFIVQRDLTEEEKASAELAANNGFSIAHLQEVVVRSILDDTSMMVVVKQLVKHKERFKNAFQDVKRIGIEDRD